MNSFKTHPISARMPVRPTAVLAGEVDCACRLVVQQLSRLTMRRMISFSHGMAAKKQMKPGSLTGTTALNEVSVEAVTKKKPKKKPKRRAKLPPSETLPVHEFDPPVLADLAIKIIDLRGGNGLAAGRQSGRLDNYELHEAINDARRFLLAAKGVIADDVDAYRLFSADDDLMSYDEIARRFRLCGWMGMTARNTVEKIILELVERAEKEVQREWKKHDSLISVRCNYPGGVYWLADRMRERIREAIDASELEVLFSDPDRVADVMGQFFLRLMEKDITGDWERPLDEESADVLGFTTFIKYVCGGMTYEQFIPDAPKVRMDLDRLACLGFFLEGFDAWDVSEYNARAKDLGILMRFVRGQREAPDSMVDQLESCLKELRKPLPTVEAVKRMARAANEELGKFCKRMHLAHVVGVQGWRSMVLHIQAILSMAGGRHLPQSKELEVVLDLIRQTEESVRNPNFDHAEIRGELKKLHEKLAKASSRLKKKNLPQDITEEMDKVAESLKRGLRAECILPTDLESALGNLILSLKPSTAARRCRPYELFLFAAQNRLCREELVRKRSELSPGVVTDPPHRGSLSILMSHRGAEIAMGISDSG